MINRYNRCIGLTVFRWGNRQIELWFCPKDEVIAPHIHKCIDSTIVLLCGGMDGKIADRTGYVGFSKIGRPFHVPAGVMHAAIIKRFTVFANFEKWTSTLPIKSAAVDFTAV